MNVIYEVAAIVGRRVKKGKVEYRVRWKGFPPEEDTWEPSSCLRESCFQLIRMYNAEHRQKREFEQSTEMVCNRSPSPYHAETSPPKKPSPSVCSSDQLSLVSTTNCSPRSASPLPHQAISPPISNRPNSSSKPPTQLIKHTDSPRTQSVIQRVISANKTVKRSPVKAASTNGSTPIITGVSGGSRKKVLVVFNSVSCDSPPQGDAKLGERQKRDYYPQKLATSPTKALIQRDTVKTVDITSTSGDCYRNYVHHGTGLPFHKTLKDKRTNAQMSHLSVQQSGNTSNVPLKHKKVVSKDSNVSVDSVDPTKKKVKRKYERKRPYKRMALKDYSKVSKGVLKTIVNETVDNGEINHTEDKTANNVPRMKSGKKTSDYIKLKFKSLRKIDKNKKSNVKNSFKTKKAFRRMFEPPNHMTQLHLAMSKGESRNLPVMVVYALDRIKKMKRKSDLENIHDVISRMENDLIDKRDLVDSTVAEMEKNGQLLRWEGSGNCSYRVSSRAIQMLDIDNSDGYLNISGEKKSRSSSSNSFKKFEKPKLEKTIHRKYNKVANKFFKKEPGDGNEKKFAVSKKNSICINKRKINSDNINANSSNGKDMVDPILPPPLTKRRKMVEESSEVSASSSSGPPTDASYQVKEIKSSTNSHSTNSGSSSQSLVNKACNIIENIQNKSKTNTHLYVVGKHVILLPPSANGNDSSMSKHMSNLPHKRFGGNGNNGNNQNGSTVQPETGANGSNGPPLTIERRISVRQTESAFKYKEIIVKRQDNFVEIALQSSVGLMRNVFTMTTLQEISSALQAAVVDCESRLVVITGTDFVFSHGVDLTYIANRRGSDSTMRFTEAIRQFLLTLVNFPKPVVAVLNGPAIGLGAALLPLCDIVYASDKAVIQLPYCYLGQTPEGGSSFTFPKVVGAALAADMFMSGRKLTAKEASDRGLVSDVFWPSVLMLQTLARCRRIAQCPPKSLESTKCIIRSQQRERLIYAIESECSMLAECWESNECKQKIQEYLNSNMDSLL